MSMRADPKRVSMVKRQLDELKEHFPEPLRPVVDQIFRGHEEMHQNGAPDRPLIRRFQGPGGAWKISRFELHDLPWVGLEWPAETDANLINWMVGTMRHIGVAEMTQRQFWIHYGSESH
jgi:hypothetical protein